MAHLGIPLPDDLAGGARAAHRTRRDRVLRRGGRRVAALLVLADVPRPEVARLMFLLRAVGIRQTVLLTGDGEVVARQIGALAGVDRVVARCLPEDKVRVVRELERAWASRLDGRRRHQRRARARDGHRRAGARRARPDRRSFRSRARAALARTSCGCHRPCRSGGARYASRCKASGRAWG